MSASRVSMLHSDICSMFFLVLRVQIGHFITSCNGMASEFEVRQTGFGARLELRNGDGIYGSMRWPLKINGNH